MPRRNTRLRYLAQGVKPLALIEQQVENFLPSRAIDWKMVTVTAQILDAI